MKICAHMCLNIWHNVTSCSHVYRTKPITFTIYFYTYLDNRHARFQNSKSGHFKDRKSGYLGHINNWKYGTFINMLCNRLRYILLNKYNKINQTRNSVNNRCTCGYQIIIKYDDFK